MVQDLLPARNRNPMKDVNEDSAIDIGMTG